MPEMNDCPSLSKHDLPTRQKNALRLILSKPEITPQEVAGLNYRVLERAPGVGKQSIAIIRSWLNSYGYDLPELPGSATNQNRIQRKRKVERAIEYLRRQGYEVRRTQ